MSTTLRTAFLLAAGLIMTIGSAVAGNPQIALVPGGPHPYFAIWAKAGANAKAAFGLGADDFRVPTSWSLGDQNRLIENLVSQGYNGFAVFPVDPVGTNGVLHELAAQHIPVVATAACTKDPTPAKFCIGTDTGRGAYIATEKLIGAMGGHGVIVHFTGNVLDPNTKLRMAGVARAVDGTHGKVTLLTTIANIDTTLQGASEKIDALLAARGKQIDGIVSTAWIPSVAAATALERRGTKRIKMVGIDDDPIVIHAIQEGYVSGSIMQNNYGQAYIASYALKEFLAGCKINSKAPWSPNPYTAHFIDSGALYADAPMIATFKKAHPGTKDTDLEGLLSMPITDRLMKNFKATYLVCP